MSSVSGESFAIVPYQGRPRLLDHSESEMREALAERMQVIKDKSFTAQLQDCRYFHRHWMGEIIVLVGNSTAGKTSIIQALRQLEPGRVEDGDDLRFHSIVLRYLTKNFPEDVAILKKAMKIPADITKSVFSKERVWREGITPQEKIEAEAVLQRMKAIVSQEEHRRIIKASCGNLESEMVEDAFELSRRGEDIIFDCITIDALARQRVQRGFDGPMRTALVYSPFHILSARMKKRNEEAAKGGELSNQRVGVFPLEQFSEIYTQRVRGQRALERITKEQAVKSFNENIDIALECARKNGAHLPPEAELQKEIKQGRAKFLRNLGFVEGRDFVHIAPRKPHHYDLIIDTNSVLPHESALFLHQGYKSSLD